MNLPKVSPAAILLLTYRSHDKQAPDPAGGLTGRGWWPAPSLNPRLTGNQSGKPAPGGGYPGLREQAAAKRHAARAFHRATPIGTLIGLRNCTDNDTALGSMPPRYSTLGRRAFVHG